MFAEATMIALARSWHVNNTGHVEDAVIHRRIPFFNQAILTGEITVVTGEYNHRVIAQA